MNMEPMELDQVEARGNRDWKTATDRPEGQRGPTRGWIAPALVLGVAVLAAGGLTYWKRGALRAAHAAASSQPEPVEMVTAAVAADRTYQNKSTSIGTVVALRSLNLRNEVAGTIREVHLAPGRIVEAGDLLVALDTAVEEAELKALEAEAALAENLLARKTRAAETRATPQFEVDRSQAELDVARARIARTRAIIDRKTIRAPFRARVGISDVHPGQYLHEGTLLTTLQGIDSAAHVDFAVAQKVANGLKPGDKVEILPAAGAAEVQAEIVALDALVNPTTRNTTVRARVADASQVPGPGASVRVSVPSSRLLTAVSVPVSALRKGPAGDHVFVIVSDDRGTERAQMRRVQSGPLIGDEVLVLAGLKAGDRVAADGSFKLRENVAVALAGTNPSVALNR